MAHCEKDKTSFVTDLRAVSEKHLRLDALEVRSDGSVSHTVVELVARVHIKLEVRAHWGLNAGVETTLQQRSHVLAARVRAELLVELVVLWGREGLFLWSGHASGG